MMTHPKTEEIDNTIQTVGFTRELQFAAVTLVVYLLILAAAEKLPDHSSLTAAAIFPNLWLIGITIIYKRSFVAELFSAGGQRRSIYVFCCFAGSIIIIINFLASFPIRPVDSHSQLPLAESLISLSILLLVPFAEELFFRGYLLRLLTEQFDRFYAAGLVSLLFCFLHLRSDASLAMFLFSLLLCYLVFVTNRLASAIIAHLSWNAVAVIYETHQLSIRVLTVVVAIMGIFAVVPLGARLYERICDR